MTRATSTTTKYKRNFLDKVVIRFDFENIELGKLKEFSNTIEDRFPFQEQKDGKSGALKIDLSKGEIVENQMQATKTWEFLSASKKKKFTVASKFVAVEYLNQSYTDKTELIRDYKEIISPFFTRFSISTINKIGLRYINNINLNSIKTDFEWKTFIKPDLLGGISVAKRTKAKLARMMTQLEFKYENEDLRFVYGIWNADYPNENTRQEFVMDFDCRSRFPLEPGQDAMTIIEKYNAHIQDLFEKNITDSFRGILRKKS